MRLEPDDVMVYVDSWGLRRLFSLALRRRSASRKKRDSITECLYQTLLFQWGPTKPQKGAKGQTQEDVEQDVAKDVEACLGAELAEGEDLGDVNLVRAVTDEYMLSSPVTTPEVKQDAANNHAMPTQVTQETLSANEPVDDEDLDQEELKLLEQIALLKFLAF